MSAPAPALAAAGRAPGRTPARARGARPAVCRPRATASGGVLVLHGEPGVGKTALLEYAVEAAPEFRVARTSGVEGEMELPFAALQHLCSPFLELMERLPQPQRDALAVAFGLSGRASRRIRSSSGWRSWACCRRPPRSSRCSASSMTRSGSIARRRARSPSWLAACWRSGSRSCSRRATLGDTLARTAGARTSSRWGIATRGCCWSPSLPAPLDERVLERIVAETRGNPLALHRAAARVDAGAARGRLRPARGGAACRPASRRASRVGWRGFRTTRGGCCSSRRPTRSAIRRSSGGRRAARDPRDGGGDRRSGRPA